ncbi:uncharacterized protein LOC141651890 [Silene latifolia]|uniref:uncharacterized protein LOC141651890 n=1 Tax=Silene latifolia TaxID=37657 RepID=UPI003D782B1F
MPEVSEVSTTVGPEDPHFIHHSDIPGIKLVGTVFDGTGYGGWKRAMLIALSAKNKLGFIDGSLPKPATTEPTTKSWQRCNDIVFSWILNSCSPEIGKSILYSNSAEIAWSELEDIFGQNGMGMNPPCSCNCQCGAKIKQKKFQEDQRIVQFLMGLNDSFAVVRGTILIHNPLPKLSSIYNNLLQEEGQREIHNAVNFQADFAALYAGNSKGAYKGNYNGYNNSGFNNGNVGYHNNGYNQKNQFYKNQTAGSNQQGNFNHQNVQHQQSYSNKGKGSNADESVVPSVPIPFCNYCKKHGHKIEVCRHLQNRNRRFAGNVFNEQEGVIGSASEGFAQGPNPGSSQVLNTATGSSSSSGGFSFAPGLSANFAGFNSSADYTGPASSANFAGNSHSSSIVFPQCLSNPFLNSWILDTGASDHMCSNKALFSEFNSLQRPYSISLPNGSVVCIDTIGSVPVTAELCLHDVLYDCSKRHLVLGRNYNDLYLLQHNKSVVPDDSLNKSSSNNVITTENCQTTHALFSNSTSISLQAFDLIHIDLWGPYHTATYNGYKYFLTIVDDFTRCTWTHLLTCKGSVCGDPKKLGLDKDGKVVQRHPKADTRDRRPAPNDLMEEKLKALDVTAAQARVAGNVPRRKPKTTSMAATAPTPAQSSIPVIQKQQVVIDVEDEEVTVAKGPPPSKKRKEPMPATTVTEAGERKDSAGPLFKKVQTDQPLSAIALTGQQVGKKPVQAGDQNVTVDSSSQKVSPAQLVVEGTRLCKRLVAGKAKLDLLDERRLREDAEKALLAERAKAESDAAKLLEEKAKFQSAFDAAVLKREEWKSLHSTEKWKMNQLDVNNAFLHGDLHEEVYMKVPPGLAVQDKNFVCKLEKSLYGLKQASRKWNAKLCQSLKSRGYKQSLNDYSLFSKHNNDKVVYIAVYVDDILLVGDDDNEMAILKAFLDNTFKIKDLGNLSYFLGLEFNHLQDGIAITQAKFTKELLQEFDCINVRPVSCPLDRTIKHNNTSGNLINDPAAYRKLVGKLNYLTNTRPDIAFAVQLLSQFMAFPREQHWSSAIHVLKYVAGNVSKGILLNNKEDFTLQGFCDADW